MSTNKDGIAKNWENVKEQYASDGLWIQEIKEQNTKIRFAWSKKEYARAIFHHGLTGYLDANIQHLHKTWLYTFLPKYIAIGFIMNHLYNTIPST